MGSAPVLLFAALGDPNRQLLLERLGAHGPSSASDLARPLPVSRQAVSKHLDVLERAGLVSAHRQGREVLWAVEPAVLADSAAWLRDAATRWDRSLSALKRAAEQPPG